jgi:hypothetical protein
MSGSMSTSPASSQPGLIDPLAEFVDYADYDNAPYQSPSLSPAATDKLQFSRPVKTETTPATLLPPSQPLSGPSHQYDLYKQQTGIVPGALASTLAVNQNNSQIPGYNNFSLDYIGTGLTTEDLFDFNTAPSQGSMTSPDMDMEFDSSCVDPNQFFVDSTVNPRSIGGQEPTSLPSPPVLATQSNTVGRVWPGMHRQQAAMAKAQAQQRQQQQIIQQQQQRQNAQNQQAKQPQRPKAAQPSDPIVEQKISQLLNSMRAKSVSSDSSQNMQLHNIPRPKKDEDDMDEDERLLASEEGKKLSSKERRQLRNKVSARAFRSRRKEYITQLESEIANKVTENGDLRAQNRALIEENKRLSDLTRMLLSSPSFSDFLDQLSVNPQQLPPAPQPVQQQQQPEPRQLPKDINPYAQQHQRIGVAMIPHQQVDYNMLGLDTGDVFYQPQVYAVLETPEPPPIDVSQLSGKTSNFVGQFDASEDEKVEMPLIERPAAPVVEKKDTEEEATAAAPVDNEFENDPAFALYHESPATETTAIRPAVELDTEGLSNVDIFGGIEPEKAFARYELVDATEEDAAATFAMARVQRISASLESVMARLEALTVQL